MIVFLVDEIRCDDKVSRRLVVGDRNVIDLCDTKQCLYIRVMRLCRKRIGEENDQIDLALYDLGSYLLVTA